MNLSAINVDLAGNRILRDVTARFEAAKTIGIVGRNGAGKTTLLRTIMGLTRLKSGRIEFDGIELSALPGHSSSRTKREHSTDSVKGRSSGRGLVRTAVFTGTPNTATPVSRRSPSTVSYRPNCTFTAG